MAAIQGAIPVTGFIGPTDSNDTYAVTDAIYGIDGYRSVSATTARNLISTERRREGMLVYTQNDQNIWQLLPSPWNGTDSDWKLFISSGATGSLSGGTGFIPLSGTSVSAVTGDIEFAYNDNTVKIFQQDIAVNFFEGTDLLLTAGSVGTTNTFAVTNSAIVAFSEFSGFAGVTYDIDYSANYTNRSLVDKGYIDSRVGNFLPLTGGSMSGDVRFQDGYVIKAVNGGGQLNLRDGSNNIVSLTTDNASYGQSGIWMNGATEFDIFSHGYEQAILLYSNALLLYSLSGNNSPATIAMGVSSGAFVPTSELESIYMKPTEGGGYEKGGSYGGMNPVLVSTNLASVSGDVKNSVALGIDNVFVDASNTTYTQNLRAAENGGVVYSAGTDLYNIFATGVMVGGMFLPLSGGTMYGDITMSGVSKITSEDPTKIQIDFGTLGTEYYEVTSDGGAYQKGWFYLDDTVVNFGWNSNINPVYGSFAVNQLGQITANASFSFDVTVNSGQLLYAAPTITGDTYGVGGFNNALFLNSTDSYFKSGVTNSVIIGGSSITADTSNTVYTPDIAIQSTKVLRAETGGGQLNLRDGADGAIALTNDSGGYTKSWVYLDKVSGGQGATAQIGFGAVPSTGLGVTVADRATGVTLWNGWNTLLIANNDRALTNVIQKEAIVFLNSSGVIGSGSTKSAVIGGSGHTVTSDIANSIILGGADITANASNTVYTPNINVQSGKFITGQDPTKIQIDFGTIGNEYFAVTPDGGAYGNTFMYMDTSGVQFQADSMNPVFGSSIGMAIVKDNGGTWYNSIIVQGNNSMSATSFNAVNPAIFVGARHSNIQPQTYNSVVVGGSGHTITSGLTNVVIAGGLYISATTSNTLYAQNARLAENGGVIYSAGTDLYNIFAVAGTGSYATTLTTPGAGVTNTITHNLGTTDISVSLWLVTTGDLTNARVTNRTSNTVDVIFTVAPGEDVRVVVQS